MQRQIQDAERTGVKNKRMSLELKGALMGLAAALAVIGASFGLAAIVRSGPPALASSPAPTTSPASPSGGSSILAALVVQGHAFYTQSCAICHGTGGRGGDGPSLIGLGLSDPQIATTITNGVKGAMPAFGQKYQQPQRQAIVAYIRSLKK